MFDDALVNRSDESAIEGEVLRRGESPDQRRRRFDVGHQHSGGSAPRPFHHGHAVEVAEVGDRRGRHQLRHARRRLRESDGSHDRPVAGADPQEQDDVPGARPGVLGRWRGVTPSSRELDRLDLVDEVMEHGIDELAQLVTPAGRVEEDEGTQPAEVLSDRSCQSSKKNAFLTATSFGPNQCSPRRAIVDPP